MIPLDPALAVACLRGYVMGDPGIRDPGLTLRYCRAALLVVRASPVRYGVYDDRWALVVDGEVRLQFMGNSDPGRTGINKLLGKPYARLDEGCWPLIPGRHKDRPRRFRQPNEEQARAAHLPGHFRDHRSRGHFDITRMRTETEGVAERGYFAINAHEGSDRKTGSAGCLTARPADYERFRDAAYAAMGTESPDGAGQSWLLVVVARGPIG